MCSLCRFSDPGHSNQHSNKRKTLHFYNFLAKPEQIFVITHSLNQDCGNKTEEFSPFISNSTWTLLLQSLLDLIGCLSDLFGVGVPDGEGPLGVVGERSDALHRHQVAAVLLLHLRRPVLITLPLRTQTTNHMWWNLKILDWKYSKNSSSSLFSNVRINTWTIISLNQVVLVSDYVWLCLRSGHSLFLSPPGWWSWRWRRRFAPRSSSRSPQCSTSEDPERRCTTATPWNPAGHTAASALKSLTISRLQLLSDSERFC